MTRSQNYSVENNFIKGVLTEFSGINYPENACSDALNCYFTEKGEVRRRLGINFESGFELVNYAISDEDVVNTYHWKNVAGNATRSFLVAQIGSNLEFFDFNSDEALSANYKPLYQRSLNNEKAVGAEDIGKFYCQFASGNGRLYVAHPQCEPFFCYYDEEDDTIRTDQIRFRIRDLRVLDDGFDEADYHPTREEWDADPAVEYNVRNQGWVNKYLNTWEEMNTGELEPSGGFSWPSKAELWWYSRVPPGVDESDAQRGLDMRERSRTKYPTSGNSLAPRGYYLLDPFNQDRSDAIGRSGIDIVSSGSQRPSTIAFMNSRVFYSGVNADKYNNIIYFSNILRDADQQIRFYQNADPTSEISFELLPNDGGNIVISDAGQIVYMRQVADSLVVLATNGVWSISGSQGIGFTATDYSTNKVSDVGCLTHTSVVLIDGVPTWWNSEGIWSLTKEGVVSITKSTIQSFYDEIPEICKLNAKGAYNPLTREACWIYGDDPLQPHTYNRAIVFRSSTGAFYFYSFSDEALLKDIANVSGYSLSDVDAIVLDNADAVVKDNADASVIVSVEATTAQRGLFKFLTKLGTDMTFSEIRDEDYLDWVSVDEEAGGVSYESYFITGFRLKGQATRKFQTPYIIVYSRSEENSSCYMRGLWEFSNSGNSGLYTNQQQVYAAKTYRDYSTRRLRIRGNGLALQLRFEADTNKPFGIIGWATSEMIDDRV